LDTEPQQFAVAIEGAEGVLDVKVFQILARKGDTSEPLGVQADQARDPSCGAARTHCFHPHRLVKQPSGQDQAGSNTGFTHRSIPLVIDGMDYRLPKSPRPAPQNKKDSPGTSSAGNTKPWMRT